MTDTPLRVLYVEDDARDIDLLVRRVQQDFPEIDLDTVRTVEAALGRLEGSGSYDVILLDHQLPGTSGLELLT